MTSPEPVKLFVALLWSDPASLEEALKRLSRSFGEIDFEGPDHPFDCTDYYEQEMGVGLHRRLSSFAELVSPDSLVEAKERTNEIEDALRTSGGRRVNVDVGYLDMGKVVLASTKAAGQKLYMSRGVYADFVCRFQRGRFQPFEWTFPDFRDDRYEGELLEIRRRYKGRITG